MTKKFFNHNKERGLTIIELLVSIAIFAVVLLVVCLFMFWMNYSKSRTDADSHVLDNARRALDIMAFEVRRAKSIYTPTTTDTQLSLETYFYLPGDETYSYIDFFLCGTSVCFKREGQDAVFLTSSNVDVTDLQFSEISTDNKPSIQMSITVQSNESVLGSESPSYVTLTSSASPRAY